MNVNANIAISIITIIAPITITNSLLLSGCDFTFLEITIVG